MSSQGSSPLGHKAGALFDQRASRYDRAYDAPGPDGYALRSRMARVLELLGEEPGTALDAGMGPGRLLVELAERGWTVSGLDASAEMVNVARRRLPETADRVVQGTIEALPFPDQSFSTVIATGVLEYAQVERALAEIARVLRPGGRAVVSYPNPDAVYGIWKARGWYPAIRAAKRLVRIQANSLPTGSRMVRPTSFWELLRASGLEPERCVFTSFLVVPSPLDELFPRLAEALAQRLERSGSRAERRLGAQVVYAARRST